MDNLEFRTIWLSDVHLGSRACRVGLLLDFLRRSRCETLYLVGDIIDLESLRRTFYWPSSHTEVLGLLLKKSRGGTRIVYIPGNHDDYLRALIACSSATSSSRGAASTPRVRNVGCWCCTATSSTRCSSVRPPQHSWGRSRIKACSA